VTEKGLPAAVSAAWGSLLATVAASAIAYVLFFPLASASATTGQLSGGGKEWERCAIPPDSTTGCSCSLGPNVSIDYRTGTDSFVLPCCNLIGKAQVCTTGGTRHRFDMDGRISGAWLRTDGSKVSIRLTEPGHLKLRRHFGLMGDWRGPNLVLDDQKSMFMNFRPDGNPVTPARFLKGTRG